MANMKISAAGIKAIEQREGSRLKAYPDSRNIPTIGVGHTGPEVHLGLVWTQDQVDAALAKDLAWVEKALNDTVKVQMTQNEIDASGSVIYNIGAHGWAGSSILKQINLGNFAEAAKDFMMWDKPAELVGRRKGEMAQFLSRIEPQVGGNATQANPTVTPPSLPDVNSWDGVKGALTLLGFGTVYNTAVLKSFQLWAGIKADGLFGPQTQAAMKAALASLSKPGVTK